MRTNKSFGSVWAVMIVILFSPLTSLSPAKALPAGVPNQPCGTLKNPSPGTLCYTVTPGGGKASAGGSPQDFSTIIQATEPEFVIASVVVEITSAAGERNGPTVNQISPGGVASIVSVATNKLRELRQIKSELQAKATVLSGPALIEAQAKLNTLSEQERTFEEVVTKTTAAGQDAGKFQVTGSARPRKCGTFNLDKCGSWIEYNIYAIRRYVGDPIAAYNRAFVVAQDARDTINRLVAIAQTPPTPPTPPTPSTPSGSNFIISGTTDQCFDLSENKDGGIVVVSSCFNTSGTFQSWFFQGNSIKNLKSGKCLDVADNRKFGSVVVSSCFDNPDNTFQSWVVMDSGLIKNTKSNLCLDVKRVNPQFLKVVLNDCIPSGSRIWKIADNASINLSLPFTS
jgi:Ricin-type beta-trefoil lectin domain